MQYRELNHDKRLSEGRSSEERTIPIVQAQTVTSRSLNMVVSIMSFFACLASGAVFLIHQSASAWLSDIASEVTVQVDTGQPGEAGRLVSQVADYLRTVRGIESVIPLSLEKSNALLEPWLGDVQSLQTLPIPRLIALRFDPISPPVLEDLRASIQQKFKGVVLDDHRRWQQQIRGVTRSFALGGLGILLLVASATTAIIISATHSAITSNQETVEVLHLVGATDRFIAREFEKHFLLLGIRSGFVGAILALIVFLLMPFVMSLLGGGTITMIELKRFVGTGTLSFGGYLLLSLVVIVIAALCTLTSRMGVYRILDTD